MIENSQDGKIRKGLAPRRDATCYQVTQDIVIPAGTILRSMGDGKFDAVIGAHGSFSLVVKPGEPVPDGFKRVISS